MSNLNYTNWWRNGTIAATKNSNEVVGTSTYWSTTNINPGDIFIDNSGIYEIQSVADDTHLTLATPYLGATGTGLAYAIIRNFTATTNAKVAAMTSELMYEFARFIDNERSTITGKSAYEIAKENGYVGTEAQWLESLSAYGQAKKNGYTGTMAEWLESLKAAGEWSSADSRIAALETRLAHIPQIAVPAAAHNLFPRFKNLGNTITAEQYAMIRNNTYDDLYVGDFWELTVGGDTMQAIIVQLGGLYRNQPRYPGNNTFAGQRIGKQVHIMLKTNRTGPMNDTDTTEGGYVASKMHTETLPALLTELEAAIGAEHIDTMRRKLVTGNVWNEYGELPHNPDTEDIMSKLELFSLYDLHYRNNIHSGYEYGDIQNAPYALFQLPLIRGTLPSEFGDLRTLLQEPVNGEWNTFGYNTYSIELSVITRVNESMPYSPHFILIG